MLAQLPSQNCNIIGNCTSLRLMSSPSLAAALRCCMCEGGTKAGAAGVNDGTNVEKVLPKPPLGTKAGAEGTNSFAATLRKGLTGAGAGAGASEDGPPGTKSGVLTSRPLMLQQVSRKRVLGELSKGAAGDERRLRQRGLGTAALRDEAGRRLHVVGEAREDGRAQGDGRGRGLCQRESYI